jgi:hypothetical protein
MFLEIAFLPYPQIFFSTRTSDRNSPSAFDYCYSKLDVVEAYRRRLVGRSRRTGASAVRGLPI